MSLQPLTAADDPSTPWGALIGSIQTTGLVDHGSPTTVRQVETLADLLLKRGDSTNNHANDDDNDALLLVLVSASWCAPCRNFSPILSSCCDGAWSRKQVKVIFCSADHDANEFAQYFGKMHSSFSALPFDEDDGEDARDELMESLGARSLPCLLVFDPQKGKLLVANAVHAVQAVGAEGCGELLEKWKKMAAAGETEATIGTNTTITTNSAKTTTTTTDKTGDEGAKELQFNIPTSCALICQYFKERLLSPNLPEALSAVILKRESANDDAYAKAIADKLILTEYDNAEEGGGEPVVAVPASGGGKGERWLFRSTAPSLPMGSYGNAILPSAHAVECWDIFRDENGNITKAVVHIENETGRMLCVFRERIVMENTNDGTLTTVKKTLNLDGVPSILQGAFRRRWKTESNVIFHALLGTCDRKKGASSNYL